MPRVGDTVDEVYLIMWKVAVGDVISVGSMIMEVETDKATVEVPSPVAGTVMELYTEKATRLKLSSHRHLRK